MASERAGSKPGETGEEGSILTGTGYTGRFADSRSRQRSCDM